MLSVSKAKANVPFYYFPIFDTRELLMSLSDLNLQPSENDLEKPTSNFVLKSIEFLLHTHFGLSFNRIDRTNLNSEEYPEIYNDSLQFFASYIKMYIFYFRKKLMLEIGFHDFRISDILKPDASRFKIMLSAIINLFRFRTEVLEKFDALNNKSEAVLCAYKSASEEKTNLEAKINELR